MKYKIIEEKIKNSIIIIKPIIRKGIRKEEIEDPNKSTLPNTESIGPNTAIRSPKLILLLNLFNWFVVGKSLVIILIIKKGKGNK